MTEPRPMTGLFAQLTDEQKVAALAYRGPEAHGDPAFRVRRGCDVSDAEEGAPQPAKGVGGRVMKASGLGKQTTSARAFIGTWPMLRLDRRERLGCVAEGPWLFSG